MPDGGQAPIDFSTLEGMAPTAAPTPKGKDSSIDFAALEGGGKPSAPAGKTSGYTANIAAGLNRGIADTAGSPADLAHWILNTGSDMMNAATAPHYSQLDPNGPAPPTTHEVTPQLPPNPVGGSESIKSAMGLIGANPNDVAAVTPGQKLAGDIAQGAASMAVPGIGAEALAGRAGSAAGPVLQSMRGAATQPTTALQTLKNLAGNAYVGAAAATGSDAAQSVVPDYLKPYAATLGGLAGGGGAAVFQHALGGLRAIPAGQQAADQLQSRMSNPAAVNTALAVAPERTLPGAPSYTPGQMSNDSGLLQMQNWDQNARPEVYRDKAAQQNAAQVAALQGVQPTGNPMTVGQHLTDQLKKIDSAYGAVQDAALQHAQTTLGAIGGDQPAEAYGAAGRQAISTNYAPQIGALDQQAAVHATTASDALAQAPGQQFAGSDLPTATQQYGQQLRGFVQQGREARAAEENRLWNVVRQNGDVQFDQAPAVQAVQQATSQLRPEAGDKLTPDEANLYGAIGSWNAPQPFDVVKAARSNVGDAANMAFRSGNAQAGRRLLMVRDGLDGSIANAVDAKAAAEQAAVQQGTLNPDDTMVANYQRNANDWLASRNSGGQPQSAGVAASGRGNVQAVAQRQAPIPGAPGADIQTPQGRGNPVGDQGVAPEPGQVAEQYSAARAFTRGTHEIYDDTPAGATIERGPYGGPEALPASQVAAKFFNSGKHAPEDVANFYAATGGAPEARAALADYAAFNLRQAATNSDGTLNVPKYQQWVQKNREALTAIPEATLHFGTAADAQQAVERIGQQRSALNDQLQSALGTSDATAMAKYWKPGPAGTDGVRAFQAETGGASDARQSLIDHAAATLRQSAVGSDGQIAPGKYQIWAKRYAPAIAELPPEMAARFSTAANAQQELDQAVATRADAVGAYQKSVAGQILRADDPVAAVGQALKGNAGPDNARFLTQQARGDPDAQAGLRRATLEWLMSKAAPQGIAGKEAAGTETNWVKNQTFRNQLTANHPALEQIFTPQQMKTLDLVGQDLQITDRSVSGTKPPIGPGTARDLAAMGRYGSVAQKATTLLQAVGSGAVRIGSIVAGHHLGGLEGSLVGAAAVEGIGAARGAISSSVASQRSAEITRLIQGALEDPQAARLLLAKATSANMPTLAQKMNGRLSQVAASTALSHQQEGKNALNSTP